MSRVQVLTMSRGISNIRGPVLDKHDVRGPVTALLDTIAPRPDEPCLYMEWNEEDPGPVCGNCASCRDTDRFMHMYSCIANDIPKPREGLRLERASNEIRNTGNAHRNSTPDARSDAIAAVKTQHGINNRKFKHNLPCMHFLEIAWYFFLFSDPNFVSALTAYLTASWKHASFNVYECGTADDELDTADDELDTADEIGTEAKMLERKEHAFEEVLRVCDVIDNNVGSVIKMISHNRILPKAYREYKKLLKKYGFDVVYVEDKEEVDARKARIDVLRAIIMQESDKLQNLKVQYDAKRPAYEKLVDECKVDFVGKEDTAEIVSRKEEFRALEGTFLREGLKLRYLQEDLDALTKKQFKALTNQIQYAKSLLAQLEEKL